MASQFCILSLLVGTYAHQAQDFFRSENGPDQSHLVMDDTLGSWGQCFVTAPINLTSTSHSRTYGSLKYFSHDTMEEPYFHGNRMMHLSQQ